MAPITEEMVRRRSEHNDGVLETLEELVLQEEGIDKIEVLGRLCPNLKQLYMPNNLIARIENMHRLKSLEYLNLALNNILKVEGLHGCEVLNKLDLTLNFVEKENLPSLLTLQANIHLQELFLTGNPCSDFIGYRKYVIAAVPSLKRLDALAIKPSERIVAQQDFFELHKEVLEGCSMSIEDSNLEESQHVQELDGQGQQVREYSVATRVAEHKEMQDMRGEVETKTKSQEPKSKRRKGFDPLPVEGRIFQRNEGRWDFKLTESGCGQFVLLDVAVGRYLDTSLINVDINPTLVRILIKGKLLQIKLPCEVKVDESNTQRSRTTGNLLVTFPKVTLDVRRCYMYTPVPHLTTFKGSNKKLDQKLGEQEEGKTPWSDVVNIHQIVPENNEAIIATKFKRSVATSGVTQPLPSIQCEDTPLNAMEWENDVPPLE
ncbi:unnamed protein product [Calypogeia fissa]